MARSPFCWLIIVFLLAACGAKTTSTPLSADADLRLNIAGMHCDGCANRIEHEIKQVDGVVAAEVTFISGQVGPAHIHYVSDRIEPATINTRLSALGQYRVTAAAPPDDPPMAPAEETNAASP